MTEKITGYARGTPSSWDVGADQTIGDGIAELESACAASRQIAAGFALDQGTLWGNPNFLKFWAGETISLFGKS